MSDNIIDFNQRRKEHIESQPFSEVPMDALLKGLASTPQNDLMADVAQSVREKMTRLLIVTDIASKASNLLSAFGFDPDNFYLDGDSLDRFISGEMDDGENALWNGPFFDWDADDEYNTTVRLVTTVRFMEDGESKEDISIRLALELFKLGDGDETWWRFNKGEWVHDGPPADIFDNLEELEFDDGDDEDEDENWPGEEDWDDEDDENSIYMYDFSNASMKALALAGIDTVDQLKVMSDAEMAAIPGLTEKDVARIRKVLSYDDDDMPSGE